MLKHQYSFQHGFQGDIYQKLNTVGFSCQHAAVISVSNLVPTAVVVFCVVLHIHPYIFTVQFQLPVH